MASINKNSQIQILEHLEYISKKVEEFNMSQKRWLSVNEISLYLGLKVSTVYQYVHKRQIPFRKIPKSRKLIFCRNEIDQWIEDNSNETSKKEAIETSNEIWTGILDKNGRRSKKNSF